MLKTASKPVDIQDLQFKLQCRLKVFNKDEGNLNKTSLSLLASASRFGLIFAGSNSNILKVFRFENIEENSSTEPTDFYPRRELNLISQPYHICVNCDDTILAVVLEKDNSLVVLFYDVLSFYKEKIVILNEIRLSSTPGLEILQANWHPTINNIFTECKSDGTLGIYELKEKSYDGKRLPAQARVCSFCWSPKGKQIAVGSQDGKIIHYKPDLKAVKSIDAPPFDKPHSVLSLQWISNYQFIGVFKTSQEEDPECCVVLIDAPKTGNPVYTNFYDICYSNGNFRPPQFYMIAEQHWNILLVASSNSMEVGVLSSTGEIWTQCILPDSARPELPLDENQDETFPFGMTIDTSSVKPVLWGESYLQPAPSLLLLSHEGVLCCFRIINLKEGAPSVNSPPDKIDDLSGLKCFVSPVADGAPKQAEAIDMRPHASPIQGVQPVPPSVPPSTQQPTQSATFQSPIAPSSNNAFTQPTQQPHQTTMFQSPIAPSSNNAFTQPTQQPLQSATFQSPLTPVNNTFAQLSQPPPQSTMFQSPITPVNNTFTQPSQQQQQQQTTPLSSFKTPTPKQQQQSVLPTNLFGGQISITPVGRSNETSSTQRQTSTAAAMGASLLANLSTGDAAGGGLVNRQPSQKKEEVSSVTKDTGSFSGSVGSFGTLATSVGGQMQQASVNVSAGPEGTIAAPPQSAPYAHVQNPNQIKETVKVDDVETPDLKIMLSKMLRMECALLDREIRDLIQQGQHLRINLDSEEMDKIVLCTDGINEFLKELVETCEVQSSEIHTLKQTTIQSWAWLEEARSRFNESQNEELRSVMKSKPLDSVSEKHLTTLKQMQYYLSSQLTQSQKALDDQWEKFQDYCRKTNKVQLPTMEAIFQTMVKQNAILQKHNYILKDINSQVKGRQRASNHAALFNSTDKGHNLENSFQNLKLEPESIYHIYHQKVLNRVKSLPSNKSNQLRRLLHNREVPHVMVKSQMSTMLLNTSLKLEQHKSPQLRTPTGKRVEDSQSSPFNITSAPQIASTPLSAFANNTTNKPQSVKISTEAPGVPHSSNFKSNLEYSAPQNLFQTPPTSTNKPLGLPFGLNPIPLKDTTEPPVTPTLKLTTPTDFSTKQFSGFKTVTSSQSNETAKPSGTVSSVGTSQTSSPFSFATPPPKPKSIVGTPSTITVTNSSSTISSFGPLVPPVASLSKNAFGQQTSSLSPSVSTKTGFVSVTSPQSISIFNPASVKTAAVSSSSSNVGTGFKFSSSESNQESVSKTTISLFGSNSSTTSISSTTSGKIPPTPIFQTTTTGTNVPIGSTSVSTPSFKFGVPSSTASPQTTVSSIFGTTATNIGASFGTTVTTNATTIQSILGTTSSNSGVSFGTTVTTNATTIQSILGTTSSNSGVSFGTTVTTNAATPTTTQSIFGATSGTSSVFGTNASSGEVKPSLSIFGTSTPLGTTSSIFGTAATSTNASSTISKSVFGVPSTTTSTTSSNATPTSTSSIFGTSVSGSGTSSIFGAPTTTSSTSTSVFGTAVSSSGNSTSTGVFGTAVSSQATNMSIFGSAPNQSIFGKPATTSIFGSSAAKTEASSSSTVGQPSLGATTTSSLFAPSSIGTGTTSSSIFGNASSGTATFGKTTFGTTATANSSPFGAPTSSSSPFGTATTSASVFGQASSPFGTSSTATSPFGSATSNVQSPFGATASTSNSLFGGTTPTVCSPFGATQGFASGFKSTTTQSSPFGQTNVFAGSTTTAGSAFGGSTTPSGSAFGGASSSGSVFGGGATPSGAFGGGTASSGSTFGGSTPAGFGATSPTFGQESSTAASPFGASSFGFGNLNVGTSQSPFSKPTENKSPFGRTNFNPTTSTGSLFGSPSFGSNNNNSGNVFRQQASFGGGSTFGTGQQSGPFSGGGGSIAQTGFGVSQTTPKAGGFGAAPSFGGSPAFGTAPTFGGAPAFGSTSPFGGANKVFGSPNSSATSGSVFGSYNNQQSAAGFGSFGNQNSGFGNMAQQQPNSSSQNPQQQQGAGFGTFASQNTIGFGNLAQQTNPPGQNSPFSGNSSFSSWR